MVCWCERWPLTVYICLYKELIRSACCKSCCCVACTCAVKGKRCIASAVIISDSISWSSRYGAPAECCTVHSCCGCYICRLSRTASAACRCYCYVVCWCERWPLTVYICLYKELIRSACCKSCCCVACTCAVKGKRCIASAVIISDSISWSSRYGAPAECCTVHSCCGCYICRLSRTASAACRCYCYVVCWCERWPLTVYICLYKELIRSACCKSCCCVACTCAVKGKRCIASAVIISDSISWSSRYGAPAECCTVHSCCGCYIFRLWYLNRRRRCLFGIIWLCTYCGVLKKACYSKHCLRWLNVSRVICKIRTCHKPVIIIHSGCCICVHPSNIYIVPRTVHINGVPFVSIAYHQRTRNVYCIAKKFECFCIAFANTVTVDKCTVCIPAVFTCYFTVSCFGIICNFIT